VRRLNEGLRDAFETPDVKQRLKDLGVPATTPMTPAETTAFIENEEKLWWPIVKEAAARCFSKALA
jgi:tripartite-type tricarboxylate transporter receptor subunit TctC